MVSFRISAVVVPAAVAALSACGSGADAAGPKAGEVTLESAALEKAAKDEGPLSFYCGAAPPTCEALAKGFEEKHDGLKVTVLRATSPDLSARYASEKKSKGKTADVLVHSDMKFIPVGLEEGIITTYADAGYLPDDFPKEWLVESEKLGVSGTPFLSEGVGIGINTKMVADKDRPTSWKDLTDAGWKGKMAGPAKTNASTAPLYGTVDENVAGFLKGLDGQDIKGDTGGMVSLTEGLGAGQFAIQTLASPVIIEEAKAKGAPVDIIVPEEGMSGPAFAFTLNPEPGQPHSQKLFAEFMTSEEAGEALSEIHSALAAAHINLDYTYIPPVFDYYTADGEKQVFTTMGMK